MKVRKSVTTLRTGDIEYYRIWRTLIPSNRKRTQRRWPMKLTGSQTKSLLPKSLAAQIMCENPHLHECLARCKHASSCDISGVLMILRNDVDMVIYDILA